jgi:hypothetical protein
VEGLVWEFENSHSMTGWPNPAAPRSGATHPREDSLPDGGECEVDLSPASGRFGIEWMNAAAGTTTMGETITAGAKRRLKAPFRGDAVLYHQRKSSECFR